MEIPIILIINKIDLIKQEEENVLLDYWFKKLPKAILIPVSALKKFNIERIMEEILNIVQKSRQNMRLGRVFFMKSNSIISYLILNQ